MMLTVGKCKVRAEAQNCSHSLTREYSLALDPRRSEPVEHMTLTVEVYKGNSKTHKQDEGRKREREKLEFSLFAAVCSYKLSQTLLGNFRNSIWMFEIN